MNKIAGITVIYNPDNQVIRNINSYVHCLGILYVVDNSENINRNIVSQINKIEGTRYIWMKKNCGIAAALNIGISLAIKEGYEWLLTMDQDSVFHEKLLDEYRRYIMENDTRLVAILAPQYRTPRKKVKNRTGYDEIYWTMQSANLLNLNIVIQLGLYKETYFIDCVDYEYCLRVKKNGYKIVRCNEAILIHNPGITKCKKIAFLNLKYGYAVPIRIYYQIRNSLYMFNEYHNIKSLFIIVIKISKIILLFDDKKEFLKFVSNAFSDYKRHIVGKIENDF